MSSEVTGDHPRFPPFLLRRAPTSSAPPSPVPVFPSTPRRALRSPSPSPCPFPTSACSCTPGSSSSSSWAVSPISAGSRYRIRLRAVRHEEVIPVQEVVPVTSVLPVQTLEEILQASTLLSPAEAAHLLYTQLLSHIHSTHPIRLIHTLTPREVGEKLEGTMYAESFAAFVAQYEGVRYSGMVPAAGTIDQIATLYRSLLQLPGGDGH
jgi:hypothetical protein